MDPVGRRHPWSELCGKPLAETKRREDPGAHPHLGLASNAGEPGRGKHQRHQASGWLRRVENHQVPTCLSPFFSRTEIRAT